MQMFRMSTNLHRRSDSDSPLSSVCSELPDVPYPLDRAQGLKATGYMVRNDSLDNICNSRSFI